jgi:3-oxoacyl-[acyl-carrier protein] reductase
MDMSSDNSAPPSPGSPTAVVTGGGSGIGAAVAYAFAADGFNVAIADVNGAAAAKVAAEIGPNALGLEVDVSDESAVRAFIDHVAERLGALDAVCVNAGVNFPDAPLVDTTDGVIDALLNVNLRGAILTARAAIPHIREAGALVFTSSTSGLLAHPQNAVYAATKIALIGFARSLVPEVAPRRIRVNCVCPGGVDTPLLRRLVTADAVDEVGRANPLGRIASPHDVAHAIVFLATAPHINGVALRVDGGDGVHGFF